MLLTSTMMTLITLILRRYTIYDDIPHTKFSPFISVVLSCGRFAHTPYSFRTQNVDCCKVNQRVDWVWVILCYRHCRHTTHCTLAHPTVWSGLGCMLSLSNKRQCERIWNSSHSTKWKQVASDSKMTKPIHCADGVWSVGKILRVQ